MPDRHDDIEKLLTDEAPHPDRRFKMVLRRSLEMSAARERGEGRSRRRARPPHLGRLVAAYGFSGAGLLLVAAVGLAGLGPFAA